MLLSDDEWQTAREVCTDRQVAALDLWRRGFGWKRIAATLDLDPSTVRQHVKVAKKRVAEALAGRAA